MGAFAAEPIKKGSLVWSFERNFDQRYTEDEFMALPEDVKTYLSHYGYKYPRDGFYYMPADNDRFVNHAEIANTFDAPDGNVYAGRDIDAGEELTLNYREFDVYWYLKLGMPELPAAATIAKTRKPARKTLHSQTA